MVKQIPVNIKRLKPNAAIPTYGSINAAGADLYACVDSAVVIHSGETVLVPTGLSMELPEGYAGLIYARSGLASKKGLAPANKVGVIDSDYRGEVLVAYRESQPVEEDMVEEACLFKGGAAHRLLRLEFAGALVEGFFESVAGDLWIEER